MPELPEVETVCRGLNELVLGKRFTGVTVRNHKLRYPVPTRRLQAKLVGQAVVKITRKAKYLLLFLENDFCLIIHLGMSGQLSLCAADTPLAPHDHVIFTLDTDEQLRFCDPRRFGMIDLIATPQLGEHPRFRRLGVEPLSEDFNQEYCHSRASSSNRPIKNFLLDATIVVGLGNIYVNEVLFRAGVQPQRPAKLLTRNDWQVLCKAVRAVLEEAIAQGGTTLTDERYRNLQGLGGSFQVRLQVYGRAGKACPICGKPILRIVQQGRSSFVCEQCQK